MDRRSGTARPQFGPIYGVSFGSVRATLHGAFLLPQGAIQRDNQGAYVYEVGADDKIVRHTVDLGEQHGADWIVLGGISPGAKVVVSGIQQARPGEKVRPVPYAAGTATRWPCGPTATRWSTCAATTPATAR